MFARVIIISTVPKLSGPQLGKLIALETNCLTAFLQNDENLLIIALSLFKIRSLYLLRFKIKIFGGLWYRALRPKEEAIKKQTDPDDILNTA